MIPGIYGTEYKRLNLSRGNALYSNQRAGQYGGALNHSKPVREDARFAGTNASKRWVTGKLGMLFEIEEIGEGAIESEHDHRRRNCLSRADGIRCKN